MVTIAEPNDLGSRVVAVTVYRSGAMVTREAVIEPNTEGWPSEVRLAGLPLCLSDGSVRVRLEGESARPRAVSVRVGLAIPPEDPELAPPEDEEFRQAQHQVVIIEDRIRHTASATARIDAISPPARPLGELGEAPPAAPASGRTALYDLRGALLERIGAQGVELVQELDLARRHLRQLEARQRSASTARQAREHELRKAVWIRLSPMTGPALPCRILVDYAVPGARWAPAYGLSLDHSFSSGSLELRAAVAQNTGEDWSAARLTVTTANRQRWVELSELPSLRIGRAQARPGSTGWRPPPEGAEQLYCDIDIYINTTTAIMGRADEAPSQSEMQREISPPTSIPPGGLIEDDLDILEDSSGEVDLEGLGAGAAPVAAMAAPAPMEEWEAEPKVMTKKRAFSQGRAARAEVAYEPAPQPPSDGPLTAPSRMLDYGQLWLPPFDDEDRGHLQPRRDHLLVYELHSEVRVEVDVALLITQAQGAANSIASDDAPSGHVFSGSWEGHDHSWRADWPVTIPSDGSFHTIPIARHDLPTKLFHVAVPRDGSEVYRILEINNPTLTPLPEGPVDVVVDDVSLLRAHLHTVAPRGRGEVGLGVEEAIKVARNVDYSESTGGLLSSLLKLEHQILVAVANGLDRDAEIEIRERVPISREGDEEVEVTVTAVDPPWQELEQRQKPLSGGYRWQITLQAGEERELSAVYVISLAAKNELVGGNRREA